jgi:hypothetical protein
VHRANGSAQRNSVNGNCILHVGRVCYTRGYFQAACGWYVGLCGGNDYHSVIRGSRALSAHTCVGRSGNDSNAMGIANYGYRLCIMGAMGRGSTARSPAGTGAGWPFADLPDTGVWSYTLPDSMGNWAWTGTSTYGRTHYRGHTGPSEQPLSPAIFDLRHGDSSLNVARYSGSGSGMFYIRLRPSTAIGCGTKQ